IRVATAVSDAAIREAAPKIAAIEPVRQPATMLSSSGGGSFIAEAAAAGLPHSSASQSGLTTADVELPVAPWWPLAAALLVVGAIDIGSDSILKAIDQAERETQGAPAHPAQVALDRSLDDELLPNKPRG